MIKIKEDEYKSNWVLVNSKMEYCKTSLNNCGHINKNTRNWGLYSRRVNQKIEFIIDMFAYLTIFEFIAL